MLFSLKLWKCIFFSCSQFLFPPIAHSSSVVI
jgi:hypothetical protein